LEPQQFNLLGTDDLKAPLQELPKATESENPKHNCNELIFLAAAAVVTAALWSLKEPDGSAEIVKEDEEEEEEEEEMEDDEKLLFVDNDITIDAGVFAEAMVLITAAISTASKASKRICNSQEICDKTGRGAQAMARNRIATATNGDNEESDNGTKDFPAAFPKRAILFFNF
jgi:hypothetical protein